jgi:hypothetical protein
MTRLVKDRFGGDSALLEAIGKLAIPGEEAVAILSDPASQPSDDHLAALDAIVAFDGTRPTFLVKEQTIDFCSSYNTGTWQSDLQPYLTALAARTSCVGRVELGTTHIDRTFLVTPTLAVTTCHVAQAIATFKGGNPGLV